MTYEFRIKQNIKATGIILYSPQVAEVWTILFFIKYKTWKAIYNAYPSAVAIYTEPTFLSPFGCGKGGYTSLRKAEIAIENYKKFLNWQDNPKNFTQGTKK